MRNANNSPRKGFLGASDFSFGIGAGTIAHPEQNVCGNSFGRRHLSESISGGLFKIFDGARSVGRKFFSDTYLAKGIKSKGLNV